MIFLLFFLHGSINNTRCQRHASVWKTDNVKKDYSYITCVFLFTGFSVKKTNNPRSLYVLGSARNLNQEGLKQNQEAAETLTV